MPIKEGNLQFTFCEGTTAVKYDETSYYKIFKNMDGGKGVDILAMLDKKLDIIEVKNFDKYERNQETKNRFIFRNEDNVETLDKEVAKKVAMTFAGLCGVCIKQDEELLSFFNFLKSGMKEKRINVLLFLEGDLKKLTGHNATEFKDILERRLKNQLKWSGCGIRIIDSSSKFGNLLLEKVEKEAETNRES